MGCHFATSTTRERAMNYNGRGDIDVSSAPEEVRQETRD